MDRLNKIRYLAVKRYDYLCYKLKHQKTDRIESTWLPGKTKKMAILDQEEILEEKVILVRWLNTLWCNYSCPYCDQAHKRSKKSHAFDVAPANIWLEMFDKHFDNKNKQLVLVLTGGEPMLDVKSMNIFLNGICNRRYLQNVRIDTNLSWDPNRYKSLANKDKIWLMCTFHPSHAQEEQFISKIKNIVNDGYNIGMINYVLAENNVSNFKQMHTLCYQYNIPLHPNPLWDSNGNYSNEAFEILKSYLPEKDFMFRSGKTKTFLKRCLFPAIGYQMWPNGTINVGCHNWLKSNILHDSLPKLFDTYTRCPKKSCKCLDMYSFLEGFNRNYGLNPLLSYKNDLLALSV